MNLHSNFPRRSFLGAAAAVAATRALHAANRVPVGVLLYSVQKELNADFDGTLRAVAGMGYQGVEFTQYIDWSPARAKEVRARLDEFHLACYSTHNEPQVFTDRLDHAIEVNHILGSWTVSCVRGLAANPGGIGFQASGIDGWKKLTDVLQKAAERLKPEKLRCGFHNHAVEFQTVDGQRPIDILATAPDLYFQTDIRACSQHADPVAFMAKYPGRHDCILTTDGPPVNGKAPLLGKGEMPWKRIFAAAENTGHIRFYLITQSPTEIPQMEAIRKDLELFKELHG